MFLTIKLCTYIWTVDLCKTELFEMELFLILKLLTLNLIVWNRTDYLYKNEFGIK